MKVNYFFTKDIPAALTLDPEPISPDWKKQGYHLCYAHKWSVLNKFYLRSLIDCSFTYVKEGDKKGLRILDESTQSLINSRFEDQVYEDKLVGQCEYNIVFYTEQSCFIEVQHSYKTPKHIKIISGKFDISKWIRPIQIGFELDRTDYVYNIKRNDILCEIAFYTNKINEPIQLNHVKNPDPKLLDLAQSNTKTTAYIKNTMRLIERGALYLKDILR